MKKLNLYILLSFALGIFSFSLEGVSVAGAPANTNNQNGSFMHSSATTTQDQYYDILKRDQVDTTDTYAIPLDDSEVEDEQEINQDEHQSIFQLPHSR